MNQLVPLQIRRVDVLKGIQGSYVFLSVLFNYHFHDSPATLLTNLSVPVEWNEKARGVHRRRILKEVGGR